MSDDTTINNRLMSELDFARTQLAIFFVVLLLAVDAINPVKIFLHVFPQIAPWHIAILCVALMLYVFISEMKDLLYFATKMFFHSILSIFFKSVEVVGLGNIPNYGPVIFTSNHANQFVDGVSIMATMSRKISYLVAEKSWNRRIIGDLAWAMGAVPVKRAQDSARRGTGTVHLVRDVTSAAGTMTVIGNETKFTDEIKPKDKIRLSSTPTTYIVLRILNETSMVLEDNADLTAAALPTESVHFDILGHIDQKVMYAKVLDKLASGGTIGIFPEGGSHDRTDLLPLKVGVALIAYSALEKDGINIPIIPVGLNYFRGHRFRGRLIVEYGRPTYINQSTLSAFKSGGAEKRRVCNELLDRIADAMRGVIVSTPDYETLLLIHTARRLFQSKETTASEKQDLSKRFAEAYKRLLLMTQGSPPKEWLQLQERILSYSRELSDLGIKDYQVQGLDREHKTMEYDGDAVIRETRLTYHIFHLVFVLLIAAVPAIALNLPVGLVARLWANQRRKKALAASKVKIHARDVMLSEKIVLCIVLVPSLWLLYGLAMYFLTDMDGPTLALAIGCLPLFSYIGVVTAEAGVVDLKDIKPYLMRLFPSARRRMSALPDTRKQLQADLIKFVKEIGPKLGEIYYKKDINWEQIQADTRKLGQIPPVPPSPVLVRLPGETGGDDDYIMKKDL
jgi:glycerol-3-phosphate O-acyltransferase/dihydroxyacetone phosphate acyltransferase